MTEKTVPKTRTRSILESFVKGALRTSVNRIGPENTVKVIEAIQKIGNAVKPGTEKPPADAPIELEPEVPPEPELAKEDLAELEELIKASGNHEEEQ